jgi:hypothetical protein
LEEAMDMLHDRLCNKAYKACTYITKLVTRGLQTVYLRFGMFSELVSECSIV